MSKCSAWVCVCVLTMAVAIIGCSGNVDPRLAVKVYPVKGKLLVDGAPAPGATLFFLPEEFAVQDSKTAPTHLIGAVADEKGEFEVMTNGLLKGAPLGTYRVGVSWRKPLATVDREGDVRGRELLSVKYLNPRTSNLEIEVVDADGPLVLEFKLDRSGSKPGEVLITME